MKLRRAGKPRSGPGCLCLSDINATLYGLFHGARMSASARVRLLPFAEVCRLDGPDPFIRQRQVDPIAMYAVLMGSCFTATFQCRCTYYYGARLGTSAYIRSLGRYCKQLDTQMT